MKYRILAFISVLLLISCDNSTENKTTQVLEQKIYPNPKDTSTYLYTTYYENGQVRTHGWIKQSQREGLWTEWYKDGDISKYGDFYNDQISLEFLEMNPTIVLLDSLRVGKPNPIRMVGIWNIGIGISTNGLGADIECPNDKSEYDLSIIPRSKDTVFFWGTVIDSTATAQNKTDYKELAKNLNITEAEARKVEVKIKKQITLREAMTYD